MIYIHRDATKIPEAWLRKALELLDRLEACSSPEERRAVIETHQNRNGGRTLWAELKDVLLEMSYGKCWYTEARDDVSDWHVDHYRPKNRAVGDDESVREGYHWLAFDWENFRISGSFANSPHKDAAGETRGKWDYFPLLTADSAATWTRRDFSKEVPLILDPTKQSEATSIVFDEEAFPKPAYAISPLATLRVERTTYYLFLDAPRLIEGRKREWRNCLKWIREFEELIPINPELVDEHRFAQLSRIEANIRAMTRPDHPYASMIRSCLRLRGMDYLIETPEGSKAA
jgi:hypothetical protein